MKNKNLILLLAAGAAYWYFFMYKKKQIKQIEQPNLPDQPGVNIPVSMDVTATEVFVPSESSQNVFNENVSFTEQIKEFSAPSKGSQIDIDGYQNYYVKQINGVKNMGVPYTI